MADTASRLSAAGRFLRFLELIGLCREIAFYAEGNRVPKALLERLGVPPAA